MVAEPTGQRSSDPAAERQPDGWRPIETLPRDAGLMVLVNRDWGSESVVVVRWFEDDEGILADPSGRELYGFGAYTHWLELPPLP